MLRGKPLRSDTSKLKNIINNLESIPFVHVGVLGKKAYRKEKGGSTNALIGMVHEFGSKTQKMPARSFLIMPLHKKFNDALHKSKAIEESFKKITSAKGLNDTLEKIGILAEQVIQSAFETGGFGQWAPNSPATIAMKGSSSPLIDTGQLRRSITSEVVE